MTDERRPDEPETPDQGPPPNESATEPPPPLAPLVDAGGQAAASDQSDTTAQQASSWTQPAPTLTPPPIAPPAMPTPAVAAGAPQPAVTWAPAPAPVDGAGQRTTFSLVAGILLIIGGILGGLAGLAVTVFGRAVIESLGDLGEIPGMAGSDAAALAAGVVTFVGVLIMVYSLVYLVAGIGVLRSRDWGRVLGLIVGILSGLVWLGSVTTPDPSGVRDSIVGSLIAFAVHAYIVVSLLFFWRPKPSTA